ncbi:MAG: hypothetical protein JSW73_02405 [Candidatus Woesearchaeota archaeon]|nr:MAG: hypothetical protein JSW73_02405 [Candidatus Woesearchaeota archaeon]
MTTLNTSDLESILVNQFKPPEYEKVKLTEEEKQELEDRDPAEEAEERWMTQHSEAKRLLPLFAAYQSPKNLDMLRESLTGIVTFYPKAMEFIRSHPEISDGFLPFAADYIETIWNTPDETFMKVLNTSEKLKTFSKNRPTNEQVPDGRPIVYVHNYFSLGLRGDKSDDVKNVFTHLMKKAYPDSHLEQIEQILACNSTKSTSHEEKLTLLNSQMFPLGSDMEYIGHFLEKAEQIETNGLENLFYNAVGIGVAYLEDKDGWHILRVYKRVPDEFEVQYGAGDVLTPENINGFKNWFTKAGLVVREKPNLPGQIRLGYSFTQQEKKILAAMTEEGKKLTKLREKAQEIFKNNEKTRHYQVYDAHSEKADFTSVKGFILEALFQHKIKPSEQGIDGGRILKLRIYNGSDVLREYSGGKWKDLSIKPLDYIKDNLNTLHESVIKAFN